VIVAIGAAFFPVGQLADIANAGTLYAFMMVAIAVMVLRRTDSDRRRPFRVPGLAIIGPLTIAGTLFLFFNLPASAMMVLPIWTAIGLVIYFGYSRRSSHLGQGRVEVHEDEAHDLEPHVPGIDDPDHKH
jgi:APA family basic amino acid/polyamine antiporter